MNIDSNSKYFDQLYFLSDEVKCIKSHFSVHYNNNNNEHFIEDLYNYDKLAQQICVITKKSQHYKNVKIMLETDEALKVIIALLFKGFSWNNELLKDFNVDQNNYVQNTLRTLRKIDVLVSVDGKNVHHILFDAIKKSKSGDFRKALHQANLYFINPLFVKFCECLKDLFEHKLQTSMNFKHTLRQTIEHSQYFVNELERIMNIEQTQLSRYEKSEDGVVYEVDTIKSINFQKDLKEAIAEHKLNLLQKRRDDGTLTHHQSRELDLVTTQNSSLALIPEDDISMYKRTKKVCTTINGKLMNEIEIKDFIEKQKLNDISISRSKTIIGDQKLASQTISEIWQQPVSGLYISKKALMEEGLRESKPKTNEEECEVLFASLEASLL